MSKICTIDDCSNRLVARGRCGKHYQRLCREDPEFLERMRAADRKRYRDVDRGDRSRRYNRIRSGMVDPPGYACKGPCESCGDQLNGGRVFHLDHDHKTGAVRGQLCTRCNIGLGYLMDDPERVLGLYNYISRKTVC